MDSQYHTKLIARERDLIAVWKGGGVSLREIARRLGRSHSTIVEEVKRNSFRDKDGDRYYVAIHAQAKTNKRKVLARRRHPLKTPKVFSYVIDKLRLGWSPEVIAGRLKKKQGKSVICQETIYAFIYSDHPKAKEFKLWQYLPRKQKRRKKQQGRKAKRALIPDRVSIHQRPAQVETRVEIGHWESDTMEGRKIERDGIHLELERLSRKVFARKVVRVSSEEALKAQKATFSSLPKKIRKTTTLDNGKENTKHKELEKLGMKTYFTDPYSAWQKGSVEHAIGLLRRYLPKRTSLSTLTQEELDDIVAEINNRPRKVLNYNTANEVFNSYLNT